MILKNLNSTQNNFIIALENILKKRKLNNSNKSIIVKKIIKDVKKYKDKALMKYEKKFSKKK